MPKISATEKWTKRVKRWVAERRAKRKAKAKKPRVVKSREPRTPLITLAQLTAMWSQAAAPTYTPPATSRGGGAWADQAVSAYPKVAARLKSRRAADKFLAWCKRRGLSPSEGRELLNKRREAKKAA